MCIGSYADISIHTPTKGATATFDFIEGRRTFQSTLPRRERLCHTCCRLGLIISIHAPARGATVLETISGKEVPISIHAPARGATIFQHFNRFSLLFQSTLPREERPSLYFKSSINFYFNPRSRERSDKCLASCFDIIKISIHAPARGATITSPCSDISIKFQSTLPREERRSTNCDF